MNTRSIGLSLLAFAALASADSSDQGLAPKITGSTWLNSSGPTMLNGKVAIVHFWTFDCINCKHNLPGYAAWNREFKGKDFIIIGIHTPETSGERSLTGLKQFLKDRKVDYPVVVDNDGANWDRWGVKAWPTVFLIDKHGRIRDSWEGELEYDRAMKTAKFASEIRVLLKEG